MMSPDSRFKVQQTKLKTNAEKITDGCSKKEQSNNITCIRNIENKKCQAEKSVVMWPVKPKEDVWLKKPAAKTRTA